MRFLKFFLHRKPQGILAEQAKETPPATNASAAPENNSSGVETHGVATGLYRIVTTSLEQATDQKKKARTAVQRILDMVTPSKNPKE